MENPEKLQELHILEQNLHSILLQKQAFQLELSETEASLEEIEKSNEDVFKIVGNLMIKTSKNKIIDELNNKKKILSLKTNNLNKQEEQITARVEKFREEILDKNKK